jgi:hypothetical protein
MRVGLEAKGTGGVASVKAIGGERVLLSRVGSQDGTCTPRCTREPQFRTYHDVFVIFN